MILLELGTMEKMHAGAYCQNVIPDTSVDEDFVKLMNGNSGIPRIYHQRWLKERKWLKKEEKSISW